MFNNKELVDNQQMNYLNLHNLKIQLNKKMKITKKYL